MKMLLLFISFVFVFEAFSNEAKAITNKEKVSEYKTTGRQKQVPQVNTIKNKRKIVEIKGQFTLKNKNKYKFNFILSEKDGEHYLTLFVKGGSCDYRVRRLKAPQQIRGYRGTIFSDKVRDCNFGILDRKINKIFNSFELVDLVYIVNEKGKIEGDITLSSLTETYKSQIH